MHVVAVLALDGVVPFDLSVPVEVFGRVRLGDGRCGYEIRVCAERSWVDAGAFRLEAPFGLEGLAGADTIVVPGVADGLAPVSPAVIEALRSSPARLVSICGGAFVLAAAGVLNGRRATTHWLGTSTLASGYPEVAVDPDVLFVDEGRVLTSAGAAAGLDLCLHIVRLDYGAAVAAQTARLSVMPLERAGGQAQFIAHEPPDSSGSLAPLLDWLSSNLHRAFSLADLAKRAGVSTRTLSRQFREQTGTTPLQWLNRSRVREAQRLLEETAVPVEQAGELVGFGSPTAFRERFREIAGVSPQAYRRSFRSPG